MSSIGPEDGRPFEDIGLPEKTLYFGIGGSMSGIICKPRFKTRPSFNVVVASKPDKPLTRRQLDRLSW